MSRITQNTIKNSECGQSRFDCLLKWIDTWPKFPKFCLVGLSNSLVESILYAILIKAGVSVTLASAISYSMMCVNSYFWNRRFTFKSTGRFGGSELLKFSIVCLITLCLGTSFISILATSFHLQGSLVRDWAAKLLTMAFNNITDFTGARLWVFRPNHKKAKELEINGNEPQVIITCLQPASLAKR